MGLPRRKPTRLRGYNYSQNGAYFITICAYNRKYLFSDIVGTLHESPLQYHRSIIDKMIGFLKMNVSKKIHNTYRENIWQRSYHDHIIRDEKDYQKIWQYIDTNVTRWEKDCFYNDKRS